MILTAQTLQTRFTSSFTLPDICALTAGVFELKENPHQNAARNSMLLWFRRFGVYDDEKFLKLGQFELFAGLSFPDADLDHLETCLGFFLWAFSTDDLSDEGDLQAKPNDVQAGHNISMSVLHDPSAPKPRYPYAAMLYDLRKRLQKTATPGNWNRFVRAFGDWSNSQVKQSDNRSADKLPSLAEFIPMRRCTIGSAMVEAMVEYSLDLDLPDYVFDDPVVKAMSDAISDIMTWPNDLCSFNKEQADGDYQNLVCIIMSEKNTGLQDAIDILASMISQRVADYVELKKQVPSFGKVIDGRLQTYLKGMEHFVQGTLVWYCCSPRYFRGLNALNKTTIVHLFPRSQ